MRPSVTTASEGIAVVLVVRPHGDRQLQVPPGAETVARTHEAQPEAEVCVVVHGFDLDRAVELLLRASRIARLRK